MRVMDVDCVHTFFELLVGDDFANIFKNENSRFEWIAASYTPAFFLGHETFQTLCPSVTLNSLVHTFVTNRTELTTALRVHHSIKAVFAAALGLSVYKKKKR